MCINHLRGLGTSVGVEFRDPATRERLGGLVFVRPLSSKQLAIEISVGLRSFVVTAPEETDDLVVFRDRAEFVNCFRPRAA